MAKKKDNRVVIGISVLTLVAIVFYDWWAAAKGRTTVSKVITKSAQTHLIIPFLWGFMTGHLFWSQKHLGDEK